MIEPLPTQVLPAIPAQDVRARPLDDTWLLTISTILLAIAVPWFLGGVSVDLAAVALGLLALASIHLGFATVARPPAGSPVVRARTFAALHALGVVTMAFIWQHAGGLQNPALLMAFVLPIIGAVFLSRWQPYVMAALAVAIVALVSLVQAPELRWYAAGPGGILGWLGELIGRATPDAKPWFAGFYAPSAFFVALLESFAIALFACAAAAEYLGTWLDRAQFQVAVSLAEATRSQGLWLALVEGLPLPAALLDADTHEILCVSTSARSKYFATAKELVGRDFFQALELSYPEPIERLVNGAGGTERFSMVRSRDALLATEICVQHVARHGRRLALVLINDVTEAFYMRSALDVAEHAALVANSEGRVMALNQVARAIFPGAEIGADVSQLVPPPDAGARWWDPGLSGRRKTHIMVARRVFQVTCSAVPLPGEETRLYVLAFLPATLVVAADQSIIGPTALMQRS